MKKLMEYYNTLAKDYDKIYKNKNKDIEYMRIIEQEILNNEVKKNYLILDIGCGTGEQLNYLRNYNILGLDISLEMAKKAKNKTGKFLFVGNAEYLPFKNKSFNCVISLFGALNHVQINRVFKEVRRVLTKNGVFIFSIANVYNLGWIIGSLKKRGLIKTKRAIKHKKGDIVKYIDGKKIRVNTKFYSIKDIENILKKYNFYIKYTFGTNITNSPLDRIIYKTFLKNFGVYIGAVAIRK